MLVENCHHTAEKIYQRMYRPVLRIFEEREVLGFAAPWPGSLPGGNISTPRLADEGHMGLQMSAALCRFHRAKLPAAGCHRTHAGEFLKSQKQSSFFSFPLSSFGHAVCIQDWRQCGTVSKPKSDHSWSRAARARGSTLAYDGR